MVEIWQNVDALIFGAYRLLVTYFGELNWMLDFRSIRKPFSNLSCNFSPFLFRLLLLAGALMRQLPPFQQAPGENAASGTVGAGPAQVPLALQLGTGRAEA